MTTELEPYVLYYYPNNASLAPHLVLHYLNVPYELVLVDRKSQAQKSTEYLRLNPAGRIPTLVDQGQAIFEAAAICTHLCEQHPEKGLIPALGERTRPLFFQWMAYLSTTLQTELMIRYYPLRHTNKPEHESDIVEAQDQRIADCLTLLNAHLQANNYLLGDKLSAADFYLFMLAEWSLSVIPSPLSFPALADYLRELVRHPSVRAVCEIENIDLSPFARQ